MYLLHGNVANSLKRMSHNPLLHSLRRRIKDINPALCESFLQHQCKGTSHLPKVLSTFKDQPYHPLSNVEVPRKIQNKLHSYLKRERFILSVLFGGSPSLCMTSLAKIGTMSYLNPV